MGVPGDAIHSKDVAHRHVLRCREFEHERWADSPGRFLYGLLRSIGRLGADDELPTMTNVIVVVER